ncbi:hypothetical protein D7V78_18605 [Parabacteroides distasonis]|uniref:Uncharacterized protein n=1 Tax=Parabacteroides distasonis TaxID=823 RepID=A0A3L7ZPG0_PARDI|nr:hypothetical protein [Parabacteroides distasonis]RLT71930.1 hypothetical protein D7V78_18605 [Parabacteroides distasonis]
MNKDIIILIISDIHSQQNLNRPKEKLSIKPRPIVGFSFGEWFVERMLRIYLYGYKHITYTIQRINDFHPPLKP